MRRILLLGVLAIAAAFCADTYYGPTLPLTCTPSPGLYFYLTSPNSIIPFWCRSTNLWEQVGYPQPIFYFTNTTSDVGTYYYQTISTFASSVDLPYGPLPAGANTLKNWITDASAPGITYLPRGIYVFHVHALRTGGGTVNVYAQFWETDAAGTDIAEIGQTEATAALGTTELEYTLEYADSSSYTLASSTSRIVTRVFAQVSGSSPTVHIFVGQGSDSHVILP